MATNFPTRAPTNQFAQFDSVATQIHQIFATLIAELILRRDALLLNLSNLREDYTTEEIARKAARKEIEMSQQHMQLLSLRENMNIPIHQQATDVYAQALEQLDTPNRFPCPLFACPTLHKLKFIIAKFGDIVQWDVPQYLQKKEPVLIAGKKSKGASEFTAAGLAIDEDNQLIYLSDCYNSRVQVVSFEGQFIETFGQDNLEHSWGIAITREHVFITDIGLHALLQLHKDSRQLARRTGTKGLSDGQFNFPLGLCIDYNGDILVADSVNHRVSIYSAELQFISNIGLGKLHYPRDVKVTPECGVVVLDWNPKCVHLFSKNGDLLSSCISQGNGPDCLVLKPRFFCLDPAGNIIISDQGNNAVKVIYKIEQLIHTIGRKGEEEASS